MRQHRVTINDVAARAGVSVATVSKVLNGYRHVSTEASEKVTAAVAQLGYVSSLGARSLRSERSTVLAVLVTEIEPFSAEVLKGVSNQISRTDYQLLVYAGAEREPSDGWEHRYVSAVGGTLAEGVILVTPTVVDLDAASAVVAVDPHTGPSSMPSVSADNRTGAVTATEYLLGLGHRRIGFVGGRIGLESTRLREEGFLAAMAEHGVAVDPGQVVQGGFSPMVAAEAAQGLLTSNDPPTAVFAANDLMAIEVIRVATGLGLRVPGDLSVIGFDNVPESALSEPPLTTIEQELQRMGEVAVEMLIACIKRRPVEPRVVLPTRLIERQSCGPVGG
jgi:LacI family transcriptional regulator